MSVVANVAVNLDTRGVVEKLRQIQASSKLASQSFTNLSGSTDKVRRSVESSQSGFAKASEVQGVFSAKVRNTESAIKAQIAALRDIQGRVQLNGALYQKAAKQIAEYEAVLAKTGQTGSRVSRVLQEVGIALGAAGVGRFAAGLTRTAATFEGELRKAAAIEGGGNFNQLRQDVERVAAAAAGTPTQVAALATSLSRAGFTAAETGQSLQGIVRGAEATAISFEQMGSIAADTMRSFGIETSKTQEVVDILVKTANSSNQTITAVGETMSYAASTAKSLGINLEDLSIATALLADTGIRGSRAGTTLSTGLSRLQRAASGSAGDLLELGRGNEMLSKSMKSLGADVLDVQGRMKPLDQVIVSLKRNFDKMDVGKRTQIANALFGEDAGRGWLSLLNNSESKIESIAQKIRNAEGAAASTQKEMQGFSYSMEVLGGNVEIVSNAIGDKFITVLQPMVNGLNAALSEAQKLPKPLRDVAAGAAAVGIAVGGVTLAMKTLIPVVKLLIPLLGPAGLAGLLAAGPWIALAAGIGAATVALAGYRTESQKLSQSVGAAARTGNAADLTVAERRALVLEKQISEAERAQSGGGTTTNARTGQGARRGAATNAAATAGGRAGAAGGGGRGGGQRSAAGTSLAAQRAELAQLQRDIAQGKQAAAAAKPPVPDVPVPTPTPTLDGADKRKGGGKSEAEKATEKAAREEAQLQSRLRGLQIETQGTLQLALIKGKIAEAEMAGNKELAISLQGDQRRQQILLDLQRSMEGVTDEREKQALLAKAQADLESAGMETAIEMERRRLELIKEQNDELFKRAGFTPQDKMRGGAGTFDPSLPDLRVSPAEQQMARYREELAALTNPINMAVTGADAIGNAFGQAFQDIATGAKSTQEALADVFNSISKAFIQMAAQIIAKQLAMIAFQNILRALGGGGASFDFSGAGPAALPSGGGFAEGFSMPSLLPGRANGGPVTSGSPYIVGERGPELFVPGRSGTIVPNDKMGGDNVSVVVNVDAKGSSVQGDDQRGNQLGRAISAAVQQELIKQKRPGGLLA